MQYPASFSDDLKYLAIFYEWTPEEKIKIREQFTGHMPTVKFYMALASAHRAGYVQNAANNFVRLENWCIENKLESPFDDCLTAISLDLTKVAPR